MALANLNGSVELTTQNLEDLNNVKYDDATSALASLGRTINMGLSGVVGSVVNVVTRHMNDFTAGLQGTQARYKEYSEELVLWQELLVGRYQIIGRL